MEREKRLCRDGCFVHIIQRNRWGKKDFKFCCVFFQKTVQSLFKFVSNIVDARMIPCGYMPMRQLSFKKDIKFLVQCLTHIKYSSNDVFIICLSVPQHLSSSLATYWLPYMVHSRCSARRSLHGNPKPTKVLEDHTPRTNALILKLITATVVGSAQGGAICFIPLWGMGFYFCLHCSQHRHRLASSSPCHTLTSVPWDVSKGARGHGAPYGQGCQACQARTLHIGSPGFQPALWAWLSE